MARAAARLRVVFLAHAPAGYLASRLFARGLPRERARALTIACVIGALFPDVDMLWFHFVDDARVHHHRYWTHVPLFWAVLAPLLCAHRLGRAFLAGVATHLALDTVAGDIQWLQPFSDRFVHLVTVPARPGAHWIVSFLLHWTFALELAIAAVAAVLLWLRRGGARRPGPSHLRMESRDDEDRSRALTSGAGACTRRCAHCVHSSDASRC